MTLLGKLDAFKRAHRDGSINGMPTGCMSRLGRPCDCGADAHNATLAEVRAEVERLVASASELADAIDSFDALAQKDEGDETAELRRIDGLIIAAQYRVRDAVKGGNRG